MEPSENVRHHTNTNEGWGAARQQTIVHTTCKFVDMCKYSRWRPASMIIRVSANIDRCMPQPAHGKLHAHCLHLSHPIVRLSRITSLNDTLSPILCTEVIKDLII
eukprot:3768360-Amphidinium_carterae.1